MFEPKKLYTIKRSCWLVFPTKETAAEAQQFIDNRNGGNLGATLSVVSASEKWSGPQQNVLASNHWSKELGCLVSFVEVDSNFIVLEVDGIFIKIVGDRVGWIAADMTIEWVRNCFEEITNA